MPEFVLPEDTFTAREAAIIYDGFTFWARPFLELLIKNFALDTGRRVLDLGCGTGISLVGLAQAGGRSCTVTGIDIWLEALDIARAKLIDQGLTNVSIVAADGTRLPFANETFDVIGCNLGVNNFDDPAAVFGEAERVLKPGGRIGITTNVSGHMREFYAIFRGVLQETHPEYLDRLAANEAHRGTRASHSSTLAGAGLRVVKVAEETLTLRYASGTELLNSLFIRLGFLPGWREVVEPSCEAEIFGEIVRRLDEGAARSGGLVLTTPMLYLEGEK